MRPAVCYVVPTLDGGPSHMAHLPKFLSEVGKLCPLYVIAEAGEAPEIPNVKRVHVLRRGSFISQALELLDVTNALRREGCRTFFVRISPRAALLLGLVSRVMKIRVFYWVSGQGVDLPPAWREGVSRRLRHEAALTLVRWNIRLAHRLVTGPERMADYFVREFGVNGRRIAVLYNDIDLERFKPLEQSKASKQALREQLGLPERQPVVLFVGRVSPYKGGHYLLPIARLLGERHPEALLLIVGPIVMPEVAQMSRREDLRNVRFLGPIPNARIVGLYQASDVFILPSHSEGFPRVLLEAMACGLPIVAFDVGGVRDILAPEQLPFVVHRGDVSGLVEKVAALIADSSLSARQRAAGLGKVRRYSTDQVAEMFVRVVADGS